LEGKRVNGCGEEMKKGFKDFGIGFSAMLPVSQIVNYARLVEAEGIRTFWIAESHHYRSGTTVATAVSEATEKINVGLGIINPWTRHPTLIAMETATLDEISKGRIILGLGAARAAIIKHEITTSPILAMRECIEIVRRMLGGKKVTYEGKVFRLADVGSHLGFKPLRTNVPIYLAAEGKRMLQLAGEMSDAVLLTSVITPPYLKFAIRNIEEGARSAGRKLSDIKICSYLLLSTSRDFDSAEEAVKGYVAYYAANVEPIMLRYAEVSEEETKPIKDAYRKGGMEEASRLVKSDLIRKLAIAGTPEDCRERLKKYSDSGLQVPIPYHILGPDREEAIKLIAREIFPELLESGR